jgi:hypothetical protein
LIQLSTVPLKAPHPKSTVTRTSLSPSRDPSPTETRTPPSHLPTLTRTRGKESRHDPPHVGGEIHRGPHPLHPSLLHTQEVTSTGWPAPTVPKKPSLPCGVAGVAPAGSVGGPSPGGECAVGVSGSAPRTRVTPRRRPGRGHAQAELPAAREEGCPGESCQGNLSNSSAPVPASCIIHGRWRPDAGTAPLRPPGPYTPAAESSEQESGTRRGLPATPRDRDTTPGSAPGALAPASRSQLLQSRAPGWVFWVRCPGDRSGVSGDFASVARVLAPVRPLVAPRWLLCRACWPRSPGGGREAT